MKNKVKLFMNEEKGNAMLLVGLALISLLAITGLAIDGGSLYMTKSHLQKTANAAVLSGAQELTNSENKVKSIVEETLAAHNEAASLQNMNIQMEKEVSVDLERTLTLPFLSMFGKEAVPVQAHATAEIGVMGRAAGAAPLGIDESIALEFYKEYKLKVDETGVDAGNFGVLALGGTGAQTYEDNLRYGYKNELNVGDILGTQTGNIAGKTRTAIKDKIDSCPYQKGEAHHRDCPRVILIPVYKVHEKSSNQLKSVKITGFAYFYISEPMKSGDTAITGMFIKQSGTGFISPDGINKGAFSIRLTD